MLSEDLLNAFYRLSNIDTTHQEAEMGEAIKAMIAEIRALRKVYDAANVVSQNYSHMQSEWAELTSLKEAIAAYEQGETK